MKAKTIDGGGRIELLYGCYFDVVVFGEDEREMEQKGAKQSLLPYGSSDADLALEKLDTSSEEA